MNKYGKTEEQLKNIQNSPLKQAFRDNKEIMNMAFNSSHDLMEYATVIAPLQHFDARQQAEIVAQIAPTELSNTLADSQTLKDRYISYKDEIPVATVHTADGHLKPVDV